MRTTSDVALLCITLLSANVALAQITSGGAASEGASSAQSVALEEIVVTAQKRSENLQNVPIAVDAVSAESLARNGVTDLVDLKLVVPTLNLVNSNGYLSPSLRGVGTNAVGPGFENPIALYIDGVYYGSAAASLLALNNVADIEVLKGPQGTLFGRNASGGLIQISTREPGQVPAAEINVGYSNYQTSMANVYLSGPLSPLLAADVAASYSHQNQGWGTDLFNGEEIYKVNHDLALRSKWIFTPVDGTKFIVIGDYSSNNNSDGALHTFPGTVNSFVPAAGPAPPDGYNVDTDFFPNTRSSGAGVSLRWEQDIANLGFISTSAFRRSTKDFDFDFDGTAIPIENFLVDQRDRQFTQEFQLQSKAAGPFIWVAGAYYYYATSGYYPFDILGPGIDADITVRNQQRTESIAGYGQGTYAITEATNLTLGGRYTSEKRYAFDGSTDVFVIPLGISLPPTVAADREITFDKFTFRASLDHRFNDDFFSYVSFNRGFKSGGFNTGAPGSPPYDPETLDASEVGLKMDLLEKRLRVNLAAFYYNYKDIQIQQLNQGNISVINGASAHLYGVDLDLEARVTDHLRLTSGVGLSKPDFKSFPDCPISTPEGGTPVTTGSCAGNQLPLASKVLGNFAADYAFDIANGQLDLNGNVYFNDGFFLESDNVIRQPGYAQLGAQARWTAPGGHFTVTGYGKNLNDRRVINFETTIPSGIHTGLYGAPRIYGVMFGYKY